MVFTQAMFSAALARRLPELSDSILKYFISENSNEPRRMLDSVHRRSIERELGNISFLCSHWASQARPTIFEEIELRQYKDMETLRIFLDSQHSRISPYIKHIRLSLCLTSQHDKPWIHALSTFILSRLGHVPLTIACPYFPATMIHGFVPSVYNASSLRYLALSGIHVATPGAFFRLPKELPCLEKLTSQQVTLDLSSEVVRCFPPSAHDTSPAIAEVVLRRADNRITLVLSTLIAFALPNRMNSGLPTHDSRSGGEYGDSSTKTIRWQSFTSEWLDNTRVLMPDIAIFFARSARGQGQYRSVRAVRIAVQDEVQEAIVHQWDWAAIDDLAATMVTLKMVFLVFRSGEVLERFYRSITGTRMPHLWSSRKLRYVLETELDGWIEAVYSDEEGMFVHKKGCASQLFR